MKGLLRKDLYMAWKHCRTYLLILGIFIFASFTTHNSFFSFYPVMICGMIPINLLAYDEQAKWPLFSCTLPCSRRQLVSVKYLIGLFSQLAIILIVAATQLIQLSLTGTLMWPEYLTMLEMLIFLACITSAIACPLIFKLGVEKGRIGYYVMIGVFFAGSTIASSALESGSAPSGIEHLLPHLLVPIGAVIYALSWLLSIRFYEKRELG